MYAYAGGDPINNSDPFGLCPEWLTNRPCGLKFSGIQTNFVFGNRTYSLTVGSWETELQRGSFTTVGTQGWGAPGASVDMQYVSGGSESLETFEGLGIDGSVTGTVGGVAKGSISLSTSPSGRIVGYTMGVGAGLAAVPKPVDGSVSVTKTIISNKVDKPESK